MEPVCSGLQAQILRCYRNRLQEVLLCADLVRAYQHCVSSAHKARGASPYPGLGRGTGGAWAGRWAPSQRGWVKTGPDLRGVLVLTSGWPGRRPNAG